MSGTAEHGNPARDQSPDDMGITCAAKVHAVITCDECGFHAGWYLDAVARAEEHHRRAGHELIGELGYAVWVGREGQRRLRERVERLPGPAPADGEHDAA